MQSGRCNQGDAITCVSPPRQKRERCLDAYLMRDAIICNQTQSEERALLGRVPNEGRNPMQSDVILRVHPQSPSSEVIGGAREPSLQQSGRCNQGDAIREMQSGRRTGAVAQRGRWPLAPPASPAAPVGRGESRAPGEHLHARSRSTGQPRGTEYAAAESASMRFVKYAAAESASMRFVKRPNRYQ